MCDPMQGKPDLESLFKDLEHPNPHIQTRAYLAMVEYWPEESKPRLLDLLDEPNVSVRRAAVRGLGAFGDDVIDAIAEKFKESRDGTVRASCVKAYAQIASNFPEDSFKESGMKTLREALRDESPVVSQSAVMALGQVGMQALEDLIGILNGSNIAHIQSAAMALAEIDSPKALRALEQKLKENNADELVKEMVQSSIERAKSN